VTATDLQPATTPQADVSTAPAVAPAPTAAAQPAPSPAPAPAATPPVAAEPVRYELKDAKGEPLAETPMVKAFVGIAGELKIAPDAAQTLFSKLDEALATDIARYRADSEKAAKADPEIGGANFDASVAEARKAQEQFGGAAFVEANDQRGLNQDVAFLKAWKAVAQRIAQDKVHVGSAPAAQPENPADVSAAALARSYFGKGGS
jgi:hypothetical protein